MTCDFLLCVSTAKWLTIHVRTPLMNGPLTSETWQCTLNMKTSHWPCLLPRLLVAMLLTLMLMTLLRVSFQQREVAAYWPLWLILTFDCFTYIIKFSYAGNLKLLGQSFSSNSDNHVFFSIYLQQDCTLISFVLAVFLRYSAKLEDRKTWDIENIVKAVIHTGLWSLLFFPQLN